MADDEQYSEEEEYEEEEEEVEAEQVSKPPPPKPASTHADEHVDESQLTEAEKAMQEAKRRQRDEDEAKLQDYEERRKTEREREEEELRLLKEKQEQRRLQREEEEREMAERRKQEEERRKQEEEERRARMEEERKRKEEEKRKKQMLSAGFAPIQPGGGPNFVLPEKKAGGGGDKFGNIVQAKQEMGMTKEQQEEQKRSFLATIESAINFSGLSGAELKAKVKELHQRICKLEAEKYDLEKRHERQEYDLKELNERQRQVARNKALKKGLDPSDAGNSHHPPKVSISSKYDRQIDRRNFKERRAVFDKMNAYPCFPNVAPPPVVLEFKVPNEGRIDEGGPGEEEEAEEEYDEE